MVDETAFRQVLRSSSPQPCVFGKAILAGCCACSLVEKHYIAEREIIACADASARAACAGLHDKLRRSSAFALKQIHEATPLTHAQEMKLQCGGLSGLQQAVTGTDMVSDIVTLLASSQQKFGSLGHLPYAQIVQSVASFKLRKRHNAE
jgi:hypothetical protein